MIFFINECNFFFTFCFRQRAFVYRVGFLLCFAFLWALPCFAVVLKWTFLVFFWSACLTFAVSVFLRAWDLLAWCNRFCAFRYRRIRRCPSSKTGPALNSIRPPFAFAAPFLAPNTNTNTQPNQSIKVPVCWETGAFPPFAACPSFSAAYLPPFPSLPCLCSALESSPLPPRFAPFGP